VSFNSLLLLLLLLQEPGAYDVVFSNWLLMYLSDAEVKALAAKVLRWVSVTSHCYITAE
jgi:hypothetical protein